MIDETITHQDALIVSVDKPLESSSPTAVSSNGGMLDSSPEENAFIAKIISDLGDLEDEKTSSPVTSTRATFCEEVDEDERDEAGVTGTRSVASNERSRLSPPATFDDDSTLNSIETGADITSFASVDEVDDDISLISGEAIYRRALCKCGNVALFCNPGDETEEKDTDSPGQDKVNATLDGLKHGLQSVAEEYRPLEDDKEEPNDIKTTVYLLARGVSRMVEDMEAISDVSTLHVVVDSQGVAELGEPERAHLIANNMLRSKCGRAIAQSALISEINESDLDHLVTEALFEPIERDDGRHIAETVPESDMETFSKLIKSELESDLAEVADVEPYSQLIGSGATAELVVAGDKIEVMMPVPLSVNSDVDPPLSGISHLPSEDGSQRSNNAYCIVPFSHLESSVSTKASIEEECSVSIEVVYCEENDSSCDSISTLSTVVTCEDSRNAVEDNGEDAIVKKEEGSILRGAQNQRSCRRELALRYIQAMILGRNFVNFLYSGSTITSIALRSIQLRRRIGDGLAVQHSRSVERIRQVRVKRRKGLNKKRQKVDFGLNVPKLRLPRNKRTE